MSGRAIRLLSALELLPLEECTSDAAEWRQKIEDSDGELYILMDDGNVYRLIAA